MGTLTGQTMTWHKVTIDFISNKTFTESPETFRDYRLDVTFTNEDTGETFVVPGFFAADGEADATGATEGNVWRVNFTPPSEGDWTYEASFRTGTDIAASTDPSVGVPAALSGASAGGFSVSPTDKTGDDFRAKGMILQDEGTHFLQHQGDGDYFVRGGPGVPENFLATQAFDNTGDGRHEFDAHAVHFNGDGDYWGDTPQQQQLSKNILGAVNYIESQGLNTIYLLTNTIGGDGQDVGPWVNPNIYDVGKNKNLDSAGNGLDEDDFSTYDVSKLAQWEILFDHMDEKGIYKNVLFQETENDQLLNEGTDVPNTVLDVERLVYMREMIARFGHNNGIQWNLGEENTNTNAERAAMAEFVDAVDPYGHLTVIHTYPGQIGQVYNPLVGVEAFDGPSFQTGPGSIRNQTIEFRDKSAAAGDPWVLAWDEHAGNNASIDAGSNNPDSTNEKALRKGMWGHLTANGTGVNWYLKGNSFGGHSFDQNMDDFTGFTSLWGWTAAAVEFFNTYVPFWEMETKDDATTNSGDYALVKDGEYYVVYLDYGQADDVRLDLRGQSGETFDAYWFDPRNGGPLIEIGQIAGGEVVDFANPPNTSGKDWVLFVRNADLPDTPPSVPPSDLPDEPTPPQPPAPPAGELGGAFKVIDPDTDSAVSDLADGATVDLGALDLGSISIQALPDGSVGSVRFWLDGELVSTENVAPYALFGDTDGDYDAGQIAPGQHTLTAEFFSGGAGSGQKLGEETVTFTVVADGGGAPPAEPPVNDPPANDPPADDPAEIGEGVFIGQNGTVVFEAESAEPVGDWREVSFDGQTGLLWDADRSSYGRVPNGQTLTYDFVVDESGNYSFATHAARIYSTMNNGDRYENGSSGKQRTDTGNDAYFSVVEVESGDVLRAPTKLFTGLGGSDRDFRWGTTFDQNHKKFAAQFDLEEGVLYRLEVSGRSDGYVLDKMTLNRGSALRDADAEESPRGTVDDGTPPPPPPPPANTAPTARNDSATTEENAPVAIAVLSNDSDADNDPLDITRLDDPANGDVTLLGDGRVDYSPDDGFSGTDSFTYEISDGEGGTDTATVTVTVTALPDEPTPPATPNPVDNSGLNPDFLDDLVAEAGQIVLHFDGDINDRDDIAALPVAAALIKAAGLEDRTTIFYNNNIQEGDNPGQAQDMRDSAAYAESLGIKTYDYTAGAGAATSALAAIFNSGDPVLSIEGGPMQAVAEGLFATDADKLGNITLLSHSSWNENRGTLLGSDQPWSKLKSEFPEVTFIDISDQNKGTNNDRGFNSNKWEWLDDTTDPALMELREAMLNAGANSQRPFYNDPSDAGMVFFALTGNQDADPDDAKAFFEAYPLPGGGATTPPDDDPAPAEGSLRVFLAEADGGQIDPATDLELTDGAEIPADLVAGKEITLYAIPAPGSAPIESVEMEIPGQRTQTENFEPYALFGDRDGALNAGGSFGPGTYTLTLSMFAADGLTSPIGEQTLTFTVLAPADEPTPDLPPSAVGETLVLAEDGSESVNLLANDDDPENGALTVELVSGPANGSADLAADGTLTYTPASDFNGTDTVSYRVRDAANQPSNTVSVAITVTPVNDAPVVPNARREIDEDTDLTIAAADLATDIDSENLFFKSVTGAENGEIQLLGEASLLTYTPDPDFFGTETLEIEIHDQTTGGPVGTGTLTIVVNDVVDTPPEPIDPAMPDFVFAIAGTESDATMMTLTDGMEIDPSLLGSEPVTIFATTEDAGFSGSMRLSLNGGPEQLENVEPYALMGDIDGDFRDGVTLPEGTHVLSYEVFALDGGKGSLGTGQISFTVAEPDQTAEPAPFDIGLYTTNRSNDVKIADLGQGGTLDASLLDGAGPLSIGVVDLDDTLGAGSVVMTLNDDLRKVENFEPYALFGNSGDNYKGGMEFEADTAYSVEIALHEGRNGEGPVIDTFTFDFDVSAG